MVSSMKRKRVSVQWQNIAECAAKMSEATALQDQHSELVTQIERVTKQKIYENDMVKWWKERCETAKHLHGKRTKLFTELREIIQDEEREKEAEDKIQELSGTLVLFNNCQNAMRKWCRIINASTEDDVEKKTDSWVRRFKTASAKANKQYTVNYRAWMESKRHLES